MGTTLNGMMINVGNSYAYEDDFITFFESHYKFLREHPQTVRYTVDAAAVYKNQGDFYGLFQDIGWAMENYQIYLRMNGFHHYNELTEAVTELLIPDDSVLANLKLLYRTRNTRV